MIRVARLLKSSRRYEPVVLIFSEYGGWERDDALCRAEGIEVRYFFNRSAGSQRTQPSRNEGPTHYLPSWIGQPVRKIWRAVYAKFWELKFRHATLVNALTVTLPVVASAAWATLIGREPTGMQYSAPAGQSAATAFGRRMVAAFGRRWERESRMLPRTIRSRRSLYERLPEFFKSERIGLLILPEDNYFLETHFFVRAARMTGVASVIVPFTVSNSLEWVQTFHGRVQHNAQWLPNRIFAAAFPRWTYEYKDERMIMPPLEILMNEYLALTPPKPWLINSGYTDALAAESPFMVRYYREAGIEDDKIVLTGALSDDVLYERLKEADFERENLYRKLGLPAGRPMLLFSVPPNQLIGDGRSQCEFRNYPSLVGTILEVLSRAAQWNVVISLHPREEARSREVFDRLPMKIAEDNIAQLIPLCDVFVASASATIRLAAGAGKPTINYDVYRYEYTDFLGVPGVVNVADLVSFEQAVDRITRDAKYREELAAKQAAFAREEALVDGRSGERMLALFDRLTASRESPSLATAHG
jgi:hypothetical protein